MSNRLLHPFDFATYPRCLNRALRRGEIDRDEFSILVLLYARANRATWTTSLTLGQLAEAVAWEHSTDWLRKRLVGLRKGGWIEYVTTPGKKGHRYAIRLLYICPDGSEESLSTQPSNHAEQSTPDAQTSLRKDASSLRTERGATPPPEPVAAPPSSELVRGPRDVRETPTSRSEERIFEEGLSPLDQELIERLGRESFGEPPANADRLAVLNFRGGGEPAGEEAVLAEVDGLIAEGVLIERAER